MGKFKDLTGMKFGKLTVNRRAEDYYTKSGKRITKWDCTCDCGNTIIVRTNGLTTNHTRSCGCIPKSNPKDLTGKKFGRLTALERVDDEYTQSGKKKVMWKCLCDCGNIFVAQSTNLTKLNGGTKSCGCLKINKIKEVICKTNNYGVENEYGIGYDSMGNKFYFDLDDYDKIKEIYWSKNSNGYFRGFLNGNEVILHRIIMGIEDKKFYVDHINHNRSDNRKNNLRIVTPQQNAMNKISSKENKVLGVTLDKRLNKWKVLMGYKKTKMYFGYYENFEDAVRVRREAEKKYFGEYACDSNTAKILDKV